MSFILSKVLWAFLSPGNIAVLLLLLAGFMGVAQRKGWQDFGRHLSFGLCIILFFISIFPVGDWALAPLENSFPASKPTQVDGIIILGGDENPRLSEVRDQPIAYDSASRYIRFAELARQYPHAKLIFSGGSGRITPDTKMKDAEVAKEALAELNVPVEHMIFEDQSRNTYENAVKSADIVHPTPDQNWLLVTSAWHMPRSMATFRKAGWNVYPQPANYMTTGQYSGALHFNLIEHMLKLNIAIHEYYGLVAYHLMGRTDQLWPQ